MVICQECHICIPAALQVCFTIEKDSKDDNCWLKYPHFYSCIGHSRDSTAPTPPKSLFQVFSCQVCQTPGARIEPGEDFD